MRGDVDAALHGRRSASESPDTVVRELEENLRALLRDMVCGHLGPDLAGIAEELLRPAAPIALRAGRPAPRRLRRSRLRGAPERARHAEAPMQDAEAPTQERQPVRADRG